MLPLFTLYVLWLSWLVAWFIATVSPLRGVRKLKLYEDALYRVITLGAGALLFTITPWPGIDVQYRLWLRGIDDDLAWRLIWVVAAALSIAGLSLLQRHISFSRGATIVTRGSYALVRQPIALCLIIAAAATAVVFGRPSSFTGAALLAVAFVTKALIEERRTQGPAFASYKHRTLMFVPVVGFAWPFLAWLGQRVAALVSPARTAMPAPLPLRREPPMAPPRQDYPAPITRVRSVTLELVLPPDEKARS